MDPSQVWSERSDELVMRTARAWAQELADLAEIAEFEQFGRDLADRVGDMMLAPLNISREAWVAAAARPRAQVVTGPAIIRDNHGNTIAVVRPGQSYFSPDLVRADVHVQVLDPARETPERDVPLLTFGTPEANNRKDRWERLKKDALWANLHGPWLPASERRMPEEIISVEAYHKRILCEELAEQAAEVWREEA